MYFGAVIFFITAFRTKAWQYTTVIRQLQQNGFRVYLYDYPPGPLLEAYPDEWVAFTHSMNGDIAEKIVLERQHNPQARFGIIGASAGASLALHAAKVLPELEKILLVTMYGSHAQFIFEAPDLKSVKQKCGGDQMDVIEVARSFERFEPTHSLQLLGNRSVLLFANKNDTAIRYSNTELFIEAARRVGVNLRLELMEIDGHVRAVVHVFHHWELWMPFLLELRNQDMMKEKLHRHRQSMGELFKKAESIDKNLHE
jgi:pimeloyl-ACP methyl ester carboxylesterase